ncbi:unnamed protein product [Boreogadus saida]
MSHSLIANTSQPNVTEGGAVYLCPWSQGNCTIVHFDEQECLQGLLAPSWIRPASGPSEAGQRRPLEASLLILISLLNGG